MVIFRIGFFFILLLSAISYGQIKVKPGEVSVLETDYDRVMVAGQEYTLKLRATDKFGNPSNNFGSAGSLKLKSNGLNIDRTTISPKDLLDGQFSVKVYPSKVGEYSIEAYLNEKPIYFGLKGKDETTSSLKVTVMNGRIENVVIQSPDYFLPNYPYTVKLSFYDREGNAVVEKSHINQILTITAEKLSKEVSIKDISGYQYELNIVPTSITEFEVAVIDNSLQKKLSSKIVKPEMQSIGKFEIETTQEIEAGQPFKLRIKVVDNLGRVIKVYDKIGKDVKLISTGTGQLIPNTVPREYFKDGVAEVEVIYTKSEVIYIDAAVVDTKDLKPVQTQLIQPPMYTPQEKPQKPEPKPEIVKEGKPQEKKEEEVQPQQRGEQAEAQKQQKTSIKLKFPIEVGKLSKVVEINRDKTSLTIKGIFENRNPEYDINKFENDIQINNQKVGRISFYEDQDKNPIISLKMKEEGFKITYELGLKNQLEIKISK